MTEDWEGMKPTKTVQMMSPCDRALGGRSLQNCSAFPSPPVKEGWKPGRASQASWVGNKSVILTIGRWARRTATLPILDFGRTTVRRSGELGKRREIRKLRRGKSRNSTLTSHKNRTTGSGSCEDSSDDEQSRQKEGLNGQHFGD